MYLLALIFFTIITQVYTSPSEYSFNDLESLEDMLTVSVEQEDFDFVEDMIRKEAIDINRILNIAFENSMNLKYTRLLDSCLEHHPNLLQLALRKATSHSDQYNMLNHLLRRYNQIQFDLSAFKNAINVDIKSACTDMSLLLAHYPKFMENYDLMKQALVRAKAHRVVDMIYKDYDLMGIMNIPYGMQGYVIERFIVVNDEQSVEYWEKIDRNVEDEDMRMALDYYVQGVYKTAAFEVIKAYVSNKKERMPDDIMFRINEQCETSFSDDGDWSEICRMKKRVN